MEKLVANLLAAYRDSIDAIDWMSPATKQEAQAKLATFAPKIGYPKRWIDYGSLETKKGDLIGNVRRAREFDYARDLAKLGKPVDRDEWFITPQTVNAYYNASLNEIVFPASVLQPPFFDPGADDAVNYGAIGAIIGHEISHGFDDQGRKIDATGGVRDWWTKADADRFDAQAKGFGAQYDTYEPVPGMHVNGQLTMGENIADLAGVLVALDAYHASLGGQKAPVIDGLSGEQRFFLGFAQAWRSKQRDDAMKSQMASDPHTPDKFRIIGPLRNVDAWYDAFDVTSGKYYLKPGERTRIW
jgi:putative endopeptidase